MAGMMMFGRSGIMKGNLRRRVILAVVVLLTIIQVFFAYSSHIRKTAEGPAEDPTNETALEPAAEAASPTNVILFIGDGMGFSQVVLGRIIKGSPLAMDSLPYVGTVSTYSEGKQKNWVTDSAAAASAMATGVKTYNGALSVNARKGKEATILELAQKAGMAAGLVSTSRITHATAAAFAAHHTSRGAEEEIALDILAHGVDVLLGGGKDYFLPEAEKGVREDGKNLIEEAKKAGYVFVETRDGMNGVKNGKLLGLFTDSYMSYEIDRDAAKEPSLAEMTRKAIDLLSQDPEGFFLMVEGGRIDHACHGHDGATAAADVIAFDEAVKEALNFAKKNGNTLIIVTADHETGGLTIGGYGEYSFKPDILLGQKGSFERKIGGKLSSNNIENVFKEYLGITDLTAEEKSKIKAAFKNGSGGWKAARDVVNRRALLGWTTSAHTGSDVPVMAYGPHAESFARHIDNTDIFRYMRDALNIQ